MIKLIAFAVVIISSSYVFAKSKTIKMEDIVLFTSSINNSSKNMLSFIETAPLNEQTKNQLNIFIKSNKLSKSKVIELKSIDKNILSFKNQNINFKELMSGFVEINGKKYQYNRSKKVQEIVSDVKKYLVADSRSANYVSFLNQAQAQDVGPDDSLALQIATVVMSSDHLIQLCIEQNQSPSGAIKMCPLRGSDNILMKLYESEFPIDVKCRDGEPSYLKSTKRYLSFSSASKPGYKALAIKEMGTDLCFVRDERSFRVDGNVEITKDGQSKITADECLQLAKSMSACCQNENECLDKIALFIDEEKTRKLYDDQSDKGTRPIQWDGKKPEGSR